MCCRPLSDENESSRLQCCPAYMLLSFAQYLVRPECYPTIGGYPKVVPDATKRDGSAERAQLAGHVCGCRLFGDSRRSSPGAFPVHRLNAFRKFAKSLNPTSIPMSSILM